MKQRTNKSKEQLVGFVGVGLDSEDGHSRVTTSEHFLLVGGSEETHERMQSTAVHFREDLDRRGKRLETTTPAEALDLLREAIEKSS